MEWAVRCTLFIVRLHKVFITYEKTLLSLLCLAIVHLLVFDNVVKSS